MSEKNKNKGKTMGWFKVCPEKWIFGSTREEMTPAERGVWMDFLALAAINDPPGQVDFFSERRLANSLNISVKLLRSTINKAIFYEKIDLDGTPIGQSDNKKIEKSSSTCDQLGSKNGEFVQSRSKIGLPRRTIKILNWNDYQNEYLRQKPYRTKSYEEEQDNEEEKEPDEKLQNSGSRVVTPVTDRGEERRKEKIKGEERRENGSEDSALSESEPSSPPPSSNSKTFTEGVRDSNLKEEFLSRLREFDGYPFDEYADGAFFHRVYEEYPGIDLLAQLDKKLKWWSGHPKALKQANKIPRAQLDEFFEIEYKFQQKRKFG
jgi:hypothetical protein